MRMKMRPMTKPLSQRARMSSRNWTAQMVGELEVLSAREYLEVAEAIRGCQTVLAYAEPLMLAGLAFGEFLPVSRLG